MSHKNIASLAGVIILLWLARCVFTHSLSYGFVVTNIFLAAVPLLLEYPFILAKRYIQGLSYKISQFILGTLWLLFLPNAFYIITDFMHLNSRVLVNQRGDNYSYAVHYGRGDGLYVFDSLLLFLAMAFGAYVGGVALVHAYAYLRKHLTAHYAKILFAAIVSLSAVGVYIGRFSRWNSWQGLIHPYKILSEIITDLTDPTKRQRFIILVTTVLLIEIGSIIYVNYILELTDKPRR